MKPQVLIPVALMLGLSAPLALAETATSPETATPAAQTQVPASVTIDGAISAQAEKIVAGTLDAAKFDQLKVIAHQKAVVMQCEAFNLDPTKYSLILAGVYPTAKEFDALEEAAQFRYQSVVMLSMGMLIGGDLAGAATAPDAYCAAAEEERGQDDTIWAKP
ncbi:hypothetical protein FBT96_20360 [Rhodobacter capsulatus]|uniref:Uncharacterized protein n=1 Tax=Rhodobacter capsulatus TaxID=1061 RepID=A0A4U1JIN1_RHOCA|nr:hypothetical protein [Rhodobacter capsulatus]TKD12541.1 hypothetical protein FBT96_20360 [Rhodobacter capsulatus]